MNRRKIIKPIHEEIYDEFKKNRSTVREISEKYGVSHQTVYNIKRKFEAKEGSSLPSRHRQVIKDNQSINSMTEAEKIFFNNYNKDFKTSSNKPVIQAHESSSNYQYNDKVVDDDDRDAKRKAKQLLKLRVDQLTNDFNVNRNMGSDIDDRRRSR